MAAISRRAVVSETAEDYLKQILKVQAATGKAASTTELAQRLKVSTAAVTNMLKRLSERGLVNHSFYKGVTLTESGRKVAMELVRHHRLIEVFLARVLDYTWDEVHDEAEHLEHHISDRLEQKIAAYLGHPTHDPHGSPIPGPDLQMPESDLFPLSEALPGQKVVVRRVTGPNSELLRYLEQEGLVLQTALEVIEKAPFNGPLKARGRKREHLVWREIADHIYVELVEAAPSGRKS